MLLACRLGILEESIRSRWGVKGRFQDEADMASAIPMLGMALLRAVLPGRHGHLTDADLLTLC